MSGLTSAIGCTLMCSLMMNSMRASPTPSFGSIGGLERQFRIAEVEHDRGAAAAAVRQASSRAVLDRQRAVVDAPDLALGAGHRHHGAGLQRLRGAVGADHGRNAELARDDRGVTGAPAALGHDRGGDLHDRLPIRAWSMSATSTSPGWKFAELARVGNDAHRPARDLLADGAAGRQHLAAGAERVGLECRRRGTLRHHGLRPRLDDVELSVRRRPWPIRCPSGIG